MIQKPASLFILFTLLALAACGGAATATPVPTPRIPATKRPTLTPPPTTTPTETALPAGALLPLPSVNCCRGRTLDPGDYALPDWLDLPLSVEMDAGWRLVNERAALFLQFGRGENSLGNPGQMIILANATRRGGPEAVIGLLQAPPQLTALGGPAPVTVAGFEGWLLDSTANANPTYAGNEAADIPPQVQFLPVLQPFFTPGFAFTTSSPEARLRFLALAVGDQTLLVYLEAPPGEFDDFALVADAVLQSLAFSEK